MVSRQILIDSRFSSVVCALVYMRYDGAQTQVTVGVEEGLKHPIIIHCDEWVSLPKSMLTGFVGHVSQAKIAELDRSLAAALDLDLIFPSSLGLQ